MGEQPGGLKPFLDFIIDEGWEYLSPCGCRANMDKYINKKYHESEIWINKENTIFEIREKRDRSSRNIATASAIHYLKVYTNHFKP
jgi:hypothetical protein